MNTPYAIIDVISQNGSAHQGGRESYLVEHPVQLIACLTNPVAIVAVDHEDETLSVLEVMPPQRTDLQRASHVSQSQAGLQWKTKAKGSSERP